MPRVLPTYVWIVGVRSSSKPSRPWQYRAFPSLEDCDWYVALRMQQPDTVETRVLRVQMPKRENYKHIRKRIQRELGWNTTEEKGPAF